MSLQDELMPGKRENAFYVKRGVLTVGSPEEENEDSSGQIYVYEWDSAKQKHIGHLIDAEQYYSKDI